MEKKVVSRHQLRWARGNCIGKGSFGAVSLAANLSDGRVFAAKSVNLKSSLPSQLESLENEIRILQSFSSPFVVQYLGNDLTHESGDISYRNLHMEYMPGGTVADFANPFAGKGADLDERVVRSYAWCIVSALKYVHTEGVVHCDVKGKNVLVASTVGAAKLSDFGSAKRFSGAEEEMILPRGSPLWMAPEVIRRERRGPESDVWSLGCTVIEMITGKPAWEDCGVDTLCRIAFSDEVPEFPAQLSEQGRDFLDKCLRRQPSERWTCEQLLRHPFVSAGTVTESSPRCVLDWSSSEFLDADDDSDVDEEEEIQFGVDCEIGISAKRRIKELDLGGGVLWESNGWEMVRSSGSGCDRGETETASCGGERDGTSLEYSDLIRTREGMVGTSSESWNFMRGRERSVGSRWEYPNSVGDCGGKWLWLSHVTNGRPWWRWRWWWGFKVGSGWAYGLQRRDKGFYGCCNFFSEIHLLKIIRFYLLIR